MDAVSTATARQHLTALVRRRDAGTLALAAHAAFPAYLNADLLYLMREHFPLSPVPPWIAVADILLAPICREAGYELYTMESAVRHLLLSSLVKDQRYGADRLRELQHFVAEYVTSRYGTSPQIPEARTMLELAPLTCQAYLDPGQTAEVVTDWVARLDPSNISEVYRIAAAVQSLATALPDLAAVAGVAYMRAAQANGDIKNATVIRASLGMQGGAVQVGGATLSLALPDGAPLRDPNDAPAPPTAPQFLPRLVQQIGGGALVALAVDPQGRRLILLGEDGVLKLVSMPGQSASAS